jgi:demethoxyubiquinone hydroxylase (CLK1/Coq7/Cat5 family)
MRPFALLVLLGVLAAVAYAAFLWVRGQPATQRPTAARPDIGDASRGHLDDVLRQRGAGEPTP